MAWPDDPRRAEALAKPIADVADLLCIEGLRRAGVERVGPCPQCGGDDRFGINPRKGVFGCRKCGAKGDVIGLVMHVRQVGFPEALNWLCGPRQEISAEERAQRERAAEANRQAREADAERYRKAAIADARRIWTQGQAAEDTPVREYLTRRGIARGLYPTLPPALRFHPALPYMTGDGGGGWRQVHCGPAMLAAIQGADSRFCAVHRTWIDLDQPKGKAVITDPVTGEVLQAKKVLGAKKGGAIRLSRGDGSVLVMGEGIETTLSACVAGAVAGASYWAGVDLGNMAGQRQLGKGQRFDGIPDLGDAEAFVPPPWVERLIYVQDGDSDPKLTRAKLVAGLRRAMLLRPGLRAQIVHAGAGVDLNDVLMGADGPGVQDD
jgi:hypothetical protein